MNTTTPHSLTRSLAIVAAAALFAGCADKSSLSPDQQSADARQLSELPAAQSDRSNDRDHDPALNKAVATLRRVTARYHDLSVATSPEEGFVLLHECETRLDNEQVGTVYFNPARLTDGVIDPEKPDALIYEPGRDGAPPKLVGVELAIPFTLWTKQEPPTFMGATFQREDEFGVFGLHLWVWRKNPNGLFAESNPRVSCGTK